MRLSQDLQVCETISEVKKQLEGRKFRVARTKSGEYIDCTCTLDIETTCTHDDGFLYTIQGCVDGVDFLFRYVEDFIELCEVFVHRLHLSKKRKLVFYIQFLSYEHTFLTQILNNAWGVHNKLLVNSKKPLYITFRNGIQFRDSFRLFQKSLARITENIKHPKLSGELDYSVYRTPDTPLEQKEFDYCVNDVQGLWEAIEDFKKQHGFSQATIPYTNTGLVLLEVNKGMAGNRQVLDLMRDLSLNKHQLYLAYKCMAGGDTHGSRWKAGIIYENCNSYDFKSAHPSQMILKKFPAPPIADIRDLGEFDLRDLISSGYGFLGKFYIYDFQVLPECPDPTISVSKTEDLQGSCGTDNGRLMGADAAFVYMDSNDFQRFTEAYEYSEIRLIDGIVFGLDYLPDCIVKQVLLWYTSKEQLDKSDKDYMFRKICVNTIYGVMAQKTVRDEFDFSIDSDGSIEYSKIKWQDNLDQSTEESVVNGQMKKLPFLWGLWTASMTRFELWRLLKIVGWDKAIYWDTDSVKYEGEKVDKVNEYNKYIKDLCEEREAVVINRKGEKVYIGSAEDEFPEVEYGYKCFKFLHAKCYAMEEWNKNKGGYEFESVIAGVGKKEGASALGCVENLKDGAIINPAGGSKLLYVDLPVYVRKTFKRETLCASFIYSEPREYEVKNNVNVTVEENQFVING